MLEGEVKDIDLVARLIELWRDRFTGAIRFENDGIIKIIYFKGGDILSASTNDRADSVDEILMRAGKVSKEHVKQALAKRKENETLGDALLNLGFITRKELTWARRIQVINVVRSIEQWGAGSYTIVADYLPKREEGTLYLLPQIVVEMIVTDQDRATYERLLESGAAVFDKAPGGEETFRQLGLNEDAEAVMAQVDGAKSASEIAAASRQETFNAFKLLHALSVLGVLKKTTAPALAAAPAGGFESAGVADAADVWGSTSGPSFQLDDEPPATSFSTPDVAPVPGLADPAAELSASPMPAWDSPTLGGAAPAMAIAPEPPAAPAAEPKWGFDEAQLEAARRAAMSASPVETPRPLPPVPPPPFERPRPVAGTPESTVTRRTRAAEGTATRRPAAAPVKKGRPRRYGLLIALILIVIAGGVGYFAFSWWTSREAGEAPQALAPTRGAAVPPPAAAVGTATTTADTTITAAVPEVPTATAAAPRVAQPQTKAPAGTPAPRPAAAGDRARYDEMARGYAQNPAGNFTVQFAIVCEPSNVTKALRSRGASDVWFIPIQLKERGCYRMFWGRFATREEADAAMARIPGELRESRPAVVTVPR